MRRVKRVFFFIGGREIFDFDKLSFFWILEVLEPSIIYSLLINIKDFSKSSISMGGFIFQIMELNHPFVVYKLNYSVPNHSDFSGQIIILLLWDAS